MTYTHEHSGITVTATEQADGSFTAVLIAGERRLPFTFDRAYPDSTERDAAHWALASASSALQSASPRYDPMRAEWDADAVYRAERSMVVR